MRVKTWALMVIGVSLGTSGHAFEIKMKSMSYAPNQIEIPQGEKVIWKNISYTEHSATSGAGPASFDTGMVFPGKESKPVVFNKPGQYQYHCQLHGKSMSGVITVKATKP